MLRNTSAIALLALLFALLPVHDSAASDRVHHSISESALYSFRSGNDGIAPYSGLTADGTGAFYGTTSQGGTPGGFGTVFKLVPTPNGYEAFTLYTFLNYHAGADPVGGVLEGRGGALYGTANAGGKAGFGIIFRLTPGPHGYTESTVHTFQGGADGSYPNCSLIADASGALYGTTLGGGSGPRSNGTVYKLTPFGTTPGTSFRESILYSFQGGDDGSFPFASLVVDANGSLYGTTASGGSSNAGTVFKLTRNGNQYSESILHSFRGGADGASPYAALIADSSDVLYGTTTAGGAANAGTVFKLTPSGKSYTESIIHSFDGTSEYFPQSALVADGTGALYGTTVGESPDRTQVNLGTVFKLTPNGSGYRERILYRFIGSADGYYPFGTLLIDGAGALLGTTSGQALVNDGSIFKLTPHGDGYAENILHSFHWFDFGAHPLGGLTPGPRNVFYGATIQGGTVDQGVVFEAIPTASGYGERVLYRFQGGEDGKIPFAAPIVDSTGALYGTTEATIYKLTPSESGYSETVLHHFLQSEGQYPSGLIADSTGALYGTTQYFGKLHNGTVFKMTPSNGGYTFAIIHDFRSFNDGDHPQAPLIMDSKGALFGTTYQGGKGRSGTVYKLTPKNGGYTEKVIYSFNNDIDGANPTAGLVADESGSLFGTTSDGPGNDPCGAVFKLTVSHGVYVESYLHAFTGNPDGCEPMAALIEDKSTGVLYGTSEAGGASGQGCIFQLTPNGNSYRESVFYSFTNARLNGSNPFDSLVIDASGAFFGTTSDGGLNGRGTIFKVVP